MSRISDLIQELCPDGVEYIKLKTLIDKQIIMNVKAPVKLKKENYKLSGKYPIIDQGQNYIVGFSDDDSSLVPKGLYVIFGDHTENFKFADFPFIQGADGIKILRTTRQFLDTKYFYYALESYYLKTGGYTRHYSFLMDTSIPIPPLEIQEEIVKILDNFTKLEAELEAELEARKKQYEYYRNKLLSFGNDTFKLPLKEVFDFRNGYTPSKSNNEFWADGTVPWFRMEDIRKNGQILSDALQYVNNSAVKGNKLFQADSIIVATSATIGVHALITIPHLCNQRFVSLSIKSKYQGSLSIRFIFYYFFLLDEWCLNNVTTSSFASVDMTGFREFPIPIPSLSEQERIVSILDKFDSLVNDISIGLPAEIEARRKQYEYYRGKLLSFREMSNEQS